MMTASWRRFPPVGIDGWEDGKRDGSGDQQGLAIGWPENGREGAVSPSNAETLPATIAVVVVVVGGHKRLAVK